MDIHDQYYFLIRRVNVYVIPSFQITLWAWTKGHGTPIEFLVQDRRLYTTQNLNLNYMTYIWYRRNFTECTIVRQYVPHTFQRYHIQNYLSWAKMPSYSSSVMFQNVKLFTWNGAVRLNQSDLLKFGPFLHLNILHLWNFRRFNFWWYKCIQEWNNTKFSWDNFVFCQG